MLRTSILLFLTSPVFAQTAASVAPELSLEQKEQFLLKAPVTTTRGARKGITGTVRATLSDGTMTHDASIQRINEEKARFEGEKGTEINFRDSFLFNIAAYRLGKMLGLGGMIPPSVKRQYEGSEGAWTWWVDEVLMDEGDRLKKKIEAPNSDRWARQTLIVRVFDQLISNVDRNVGNTLYDKEWRVWMIDHTRAFRLHAQPMNPKVLTKCDRQLLAAMKSLRKEKLKAELSPYLRDNQIHALLQRRDAIVKHFEKGGAEVLYDFLPAQH